MSERWGIRRWQKIGWTGTMATAESVRVSEVVLRPCAVVDAEAVERLRVSGWKAAYRGLVPDSFLDGMLADVERRRQLIASQGGQVMETVAVSGADVVGWIVAGSCRDADRTYPWQGEIYGCYVLPGWWGNGIGRRLLDHTANALQEGGRMDLSLWVLEGNVRARRFYESCQFLPEGKRQLLDLCGPVPEVRYLRHLTS
jgi:ribosomal protein S18 acetylase RimI-like enzyme